jgi:hypothetical protein
MKFGGKIILISLFVSSILSVTIVQSSCQLQQDDTIETYSTYVDTSSRGVTNDGITLEREKGTNNPFITNRLVFYDDGLYIKILCGLNWNSRDDHCYYYGLNVAIHNYDLKTINGHWYITIKSPPLNLMDGRWNNDFSLGPDEELFIKIMPDKIIKLKNNDFLRCGKIEIDISVNDNQLKATGFVWGKFILNLQIV